LRIVVSDTGPILHLREAGVLDVLQFAGEIIVPAAVDDELLRLVDDWPTARPAWLQRRTLDVADPSSPLHGLVAGLGAGETEAILLARQIEADWLLTDDAEARVIAGLAGLEVHGSLGVVLWAAAAGHFGLAEAQTALDRLAKSSLWISASILAEARAALPKLTEKP
jgi:predicted nucleic acid-binding protein